MTKTKIEQIGFKTYAEYWQHLKKQRENKSEVTTKTKRIDTNRSNSSVMN